MAPRASSSLPARGLALVVGAAALYRLVAPAAAFLVSAGGSQRSTTRSQDASAILAPGLRGKQMRLAPEGVAGGRQPAVARGDGEEAMQTTITAISSLAGLSFGIFFAKSLEDSAIVSQERVAKTSPELFNRMSADAGMEDVEDTQDDKMNTIVEKMAEAQGLEKKQAAKKKTEDDDGW
eukprot:TRINITY_DN1221_c0_g2_i1.p1 TRINITY_DN1221_c0_g2~~TRINITY_DN1221_c0_g2_i1.p1  ORF type:complete len:179 (+),score=65.35 TRINITY_DN1221_c0_g2_i1:159-695(+)